MTEELRQENHLRRASSEKPLQKHRLKCWRAPSPKTARTPDFCGASGAALQLAQARGGRFRAVAVPEGSGRLQCPKVPSGCNTGGLPGLLISNQDLVEPPLCNEHNRDCEQDTETEEQ